MSIVLDVYQEGKTLKAYLPDAKIKTGATPDMTLAPMPLELRQGYKWATWGDNDFLPTETRMKLDKVGIAGRVQYDLAKSLYGNGLVYARRSDIEANPTGFQRAYIPAVQDFLEANRIETEWLFPQFLDYRYHANTMSELGMSRSKQLVTNLWHKEVEFCRVELQNPSNLRFENIYYSPDFAMGYPPAEQRYKKIPLFTWFQQKRFLQKLRGFKFAWHSRIKTPGIMYYARPFWLGLCREKGWLDVSINVPQIVYAMQNNQVKIMYQILISEEYFKIRHQNWATYTDEERNLHIDKFIDYINDKLEGIENNFKSITTIFREDEVTHEEYGKIEIKAVDDRTKKDEWVPSSEKSDAQIVQGLGGHPSMIGLAPEGGSMGAGSGSDKKELYNIEIDTNTVEQQSILEPLNWSARYNAQRYKDWDVVFFIDHNRHTTKDKNESGVEEKEERDNE